MNCNKEIQQKSCCEPIMVFEDVSNYYTKQEVNDQIVSATSGMATQEWVEDQGYLTEHQSLSGYATEEYVQDYTYDKQTIDDKVAQGGSFDPTKYYNKTATDALLDEKLAVSGFQAYSGTVASELSGKASQSTVDALSGQIQSISSSTSGDVTVISGDVITISGDVASISSDLSAHTANTSIHVTTAQTASWDAKSNFSGSYNDLTNKPTIPSIWSGTEAQWSQISGGTLDNNTIYLVY